MLLLLADDDNQSVFAAAIDLICGRNNTTDDGYGGIEGGRLPSPFG